MIPVKGKRQVGKRRSAFGLVRCDEERIDGGS